MCVNGRRGDDFHARGCPFELNIGGKKWIVDGYLDYGGSRDWGSTFKGTFTHEKEGVLVVFGSGESHFKERSFGIGVGFDEDEQERIKEVLIGHVFSRYKWNYIEAFSLEKAGYIAFETPSTFLL